MENKLMNLILDACDDRLIYKNKNINLFETGLLDSMGFIKLLISIEENFNIEIEPAEITKEKMSTPNQLMAFVTEKINGTTV